MMHNSLVPTEVFEGVGEPSGFGLGLARVLHAVCLLSLSTAGVEATGFVEGDVLVGIEKGRVAHFSSNGTKRQQLSSGSAQDHVRGMCFDADGNLYATNFVSRTMSKFDRSGRLVDASWGGPFGGNPESCVVDGEGNVYTGELDGENRIRKFDRHGKALQSFRPQTERRGVDWIDLAADQCTMLYTSEGSRVMRFDVCEGRQLTDLARLGGQCFALRVREDGSVLVACQDRAHLLSAEGRSLRTYPVANEQLFALNIDPDGQHFWTAGLASGNVYRIDIGSGQGATAPRFNGAEAKARDTSSLFGQLRNLFDQAPARGLAVYGEKTAAMAEAVRRQEAAQQDAESRRLAELRRQAAEAEQKAAAAQAEKDRQKREAAQRAEAERQRLEAERRAAAERLEAERSAEAERQRLESEHLEAEARAEAERRRLEAERLRVEEAARPQAPVRFGPGREVSLRPSEASNAAAQLQGTLDLAGSTTESKALFRLGTDLAVRGISLEVETAEGWQTLGAEGIEMPLDPAGQRQWSVRARVDRCTPGTGEGARHHLWLEAKGFDQEITRLDLPLGLAVEATPWLRCWGRTIAGMAGLLVAGLLVHGWVSPARFARRVGVVLSPEEDLGEGFFHPIRAQRGSGSGFYRDARVFIGRDFRLTRRSAGALARLRAHGRQVWLQPWAGASVERRTADDAWEPVAAEDARMRPGVLYRDAAGGFYFELSAR